MNFYPLLQAITRTACQFFQNRFDTQGQNRSSIQKCPLQGLYNGQNFPISVYRGEDELWTSLSHRSESLAKFCKATFRCQFDKFVSDIPSSLLIVLHSCNFKATYGCINRKFKKKKYLLRIRPFLNMAKKLTIKSCFINCFYCKLIIFSNINR